MEDNKKFNRLKDLDLSNVEVFYSQVKNAVAFAESNNPMSEEDRHRMLETFAIMEGSKNPLNEKQKIITIAELYGFLDPMDFVTLIKNDPSAVLFLKDYKSDYTKIEKIHSNAMNDAIFSGNFSVKAKSNNPLSGQVPSIHQNEVGRANQASSPSRKLK